MIFIIETIFKKYFYLKRYMKIKLQILFSIALFYIKIPKIIPKICKI